jgi:hypothetical protein
VGDGIARASRLRLGIAASLAFFTALALWPALTPARADTPPPMALMAAPGYASDASAAGTFTVAWSSATGPVAPGGWFDVQYRSGANGLWRSLVSSTSATSYLFQGGAPGKTYYFHAREVSPGGTPGPWSSDKRTVVPFDQRSGSYRGSWRTVTGSSLYRGSARSSASRGSRVTIGFVAARSVSLLVTKRPTGGIADVYVDGRRVKRVDTYSPTTRYRVIVTVKVNSAPRTGSLMVVVTGTKRRGSHGARVEIDGFPIDIAVRPVFGIDSGLASLDPTERTRALDMLVGAGCRWARVGVLWPYIDRHVYSAGETALTYDPAVPNSRGRDWQSLDAAVSDYSARDMKMVGLLLGYAAWASGYGQPINNAPHGDYYVPASHAAYVQFVKDVVSRYKDRIHYWQIWNEPNGPFWYRRPYDRIPRPDPAAYAVLLHDAYLGIKQVDPTAKVLTGGDRCDWTYMQKVYNKMKARYPAAANKANHYYFDLLGVHPYNDNRPPESKDPRFIWKTMDRNFTGLPKMKALMARNGEPNKHIIITEMAWPLAPGQAKGVNRLSFTKGVTRAQQAAYLARAYRMVEAWPWIDAMLWYGFDNWVDWHYTRENRRPPAGAPAGESTFSLVNVDMTARPSFRAYSAEANR